MLVTCFSTARSVTTSSDAMPEFERPCGHVLEHLALARRERVDGVVAAAAADELGDDRRVERRAALPHAPYGGGELAHVGDAVLEQVADSLGAFGEELHRVRRLDVLREHEHADIREAPPGSPAPPAAPRRCGSGGMRMSTITTFGE